MGANDSSPVVQRRLLRTELRKARQEAGLTQKQVAAATDWSLSKVIRVEAGTVSVSAGDLETLLRLYKIVDPIRVGELIVIAGPKSPSQSTARSKTRDGISSGNSKNSTTPAKKNFSNKIIGQPLSSDRRGLLDGDEKTTKQCHQEGRRPVITPGTQLPASRSSVAPVSSWDFYERQDVRALRDDDSLKRNIRWRWHQAAQRLVSLAGVAALVLAFLDLVKLEGLPPQTAAHLTLACFISGSGGYVLHEVITVLIGKRRSGDGKVGDDSSS